MRELKVRMVEGCSGGAALERNAPSARIVPGEWKDTADRSRMTPSDRHQCLSAARSPRSVVEESPASAELIVSDPRRPRHDQIGSMPGFPAPGLTALEQDHPSRRSGVVGDGPIEVDTAVRLD